jgi:hypothetical protein
MHSYCHDLEVCDYRWGMECITTFIEHLYTQLVTTSNYNAIADLHTLQITTAHAKYFPACCALPAVPWQRLLTPEILQLPALRSFLRRLSYRTACQLFPPESSIQFSAATDNSLVAISSQLFCQLPTPETLSIIFDC